MSVIGNAPFRIGLWRVDPSLDEISRAGSTIKLEPRAMRVLVCLAEHDGEVVSVDRLLDTVWKDLVVTQYSVYQAVASLRRALGDDPKDPIYIANVPRRGYRLVAPVEADARVPGDLHASDDREQLPQPMPLAAEPATESVQAQEPSTPPAEKFQPALLPDLPEGGHSAEHRWGVRYGSILLVLLVLAGIVAWLLSGRGRPVGGEAVRAPVATGALEADVAVFAPPRHSVAVLPFTNLSGDPHQDYFSDGMSEELISALSRIEALKVTARTSSFSFKGKDADIGTIARKLNVAAILEGSVRRSGNQVRITAQLVNGVNGFHIWSQDYDRDLSNVLVLQADIATAVARELQARLLGDEAPKIELGGTRNPAAFDAYLRGLKAYSSSPDNAKELQVAIAAYSDAIRLDPQYALAFAGRSVARTDYAVEYSTGRAIRENFGTAQADAHQALVLAPALAEGHLALARLLDTGSFEFTQAYKAHEQALVLAAGNAEVLRQYGAFAVRVGHIDSGLTYARRAVELDPLNPRSYSLLGQALYFARRYEEAAAAFAEVIQLDPDNKLAFGFRGLAYYGAGDLHSARSSCEAKPGHWTTQWCLAVTYDRLGQHTDAEAVLTGMKTAHGDAAAYQYATIYSQWGSRPKALEWLDTAMQVRDPGLIYLKTDPLMDPVRNEPRFQAIERELKFPD